MPARDASPAEVAGPPSRSARYSPSRSPRYTDRMSNMPIPAPNRRPTSSSVVFAGASTVSVTVRLLRPSGWSSSSGEGSGCAITDGGPADIVGAMRTFATLDRPRPALALSVVLLAIPIAFVLLVPHPLEQPFGVDFRLYQDATARWLASGQFYEPYQLAGPYPISAGDILYPPVALWLFVPFAVDGGPVLDAIQAVVWWALPLGVVAAVVV